MVESLLYTPYGMVLRSLKAANGVPLSVKEIAEKIMQNYCYAIGRPTIVEAIDHFRRTYHIREETERRGKLKIPVKVFSILTITNQSEHEPIAINANDNGICSEPGSGVE